MSYLDTISEYEKRRIKYTKIVKVSVGVTLKSYCSWP